LSRPTAEPEAPDDSYADQDLSLLIPERLARAIGRRRAAWSPVDTVAAWLIGLHLLLLLIVVGRGSFYLDDLRAQGYALNQPFWQFIVGSNGTHFAPIPRILDWTQSRYAPLQHTPAVLITLLVRLLLAVGFWRVLRRIFGDRPRTLVPLALLLFTPALIPATAWYRQSITILACTVAMIWAVDALLRWVLYRHRFDLVMVLVATAIGVGCYEKAAAIPVILLGLALALFADRQSAGSVLRRPRTGRASALQAALIGVLTSTVAVVIFLVIYRSGPYDQGGGSAPSIVEILRLSWRASTLTIVPLLLGGPYHWAATAPYISDPSINSTVIAFCLVLMLIGLAVALRRSPGRTARAVILLLAWTIPSVTIVVAGRFGVFGPFLAHTTRLWADLVPGFLLAGALAVLPWRIGVARTDAVEPAPRIRKDAALEVTVPVLAAGLVMAVVLGGSVFSAFSYGSAWWKNPTGQWIANARASLVNSDPYPYPRELAVPLPEAVMPYWVATTFPTDAPLLLLLRPDLRFHDGDGEAKMLNASGIRSSYSTKVLAEAKSTKLCVAVVPAGSDQPQSIPLDKVAKYALGGQIEVGLLLSEPTKVEVSVVTPAGLVVTPQRFSNAELPQGPHRVHFPVPFGTAITSVQVRTHTTTHKSCVSSVQVWEPVP
jgi:hypothetical protein